MVKSFSKPTFREVDKINDDRFLVTYNRSSVLASTPIYVGFSILDHAKLYIYKFWYSTILPTYGKRAQFVYNDTDSFVINLYTNDIVDEINGPLGSHLDLSNFPQDHPLHSNKCKGELGKLKIETAPYHMKVLVSLKPKAYTYTTTYSDQVYHTTLKGIPKHIRDTLTLDMYTHTLYNNSQTRGDLVNLRFYNTDISLTKNSKIILSSYEDKRFYINNVKSYGYRHYKCKSHHIGDEDNTQNDETEEHSSGRNYHSIFEKKKNKIKKKTKMILRKKNLLYFDFHLRLIYVYIYIYIYIYMSFVVLQNPEVIHNSLARVVYT